MPCYSEGNVNEQRGRGVFQRSIEGLQALNGAGYGQPGTKLQLDLVYNPNGAFLAPPTSALQVCLQDPHTHKRYAAHSLRTPPSLASRCLPFK